MIPLGTTLVATLAFAAPHAPCVQDTALARVDWSITEAERSEVLVLASDHLGQQAGFEPAHLEELLELLVEFAPDAIGVEVMPGRTLAMMQGADDTFAAVLEQFAGAGLTHAVRAREELELTRGAAERRLGERLAGGELSGIRGELVLLALAADDVPTAVLQWRHAQLESSATDGVPQDAARYLELRSREPNEVYSLAVELALRLGLQRVTGIDDHADKDLYLGVAGQLQAELGGVEELRAIADAPLFRSSRSSLKSARRAGSLLSHYLFLNSIEYQVEDAETQWDLFLRTRLPSKLDRTRAALWDVRNLNIASNVRRLTARSPGGRTLVVIGASHKAFLDAHLAACMDVQLVPLERLVD
jgi:hypothetical protein